MIRLKRKLYTIEEGHYTGSKDLEKLPGVISTIGKSTFLGAGIGAGIGMGISELSKLSNSESFNKSPISTGLKQGGKIGFISGVLYKLLLNHYHKPMKSIKFNEIDRSIRKEFGIIKLGNIPNIGDNESRSRLNEKISFNNREVLSYKINIVVCDNKFVLYTLCLSDSELSNLSDYLDLFCKEYLGIEYSSKPINRTTNTYQVAITFTNYDIITKFILGLNDIVNSKVNILNNDAKIKLDLIDSNKEADLEKAFSFTDNIKLLDKYDLFKLFIKGSSKMFFGNKSSSAKFFIDSILNSLYKLTSSERSNLLGNYKVKDLDNIYLLNTLKRLRFQKGLNYTVGSDNPIITCYLSEGSFIICLNDSYKNARDVIDLLESNGAVLTESNRVLTLVYHISDRTSFDLLLVKLMRIIKTINIHTR